MDKTKTEEMEDIPRATARGTNLSVSFKHSVNIGRVIRGRDVAYAVRYLVDVVNGKRAIPTKRYGNDTSHKPGIAGGRFHSKASVEILRLINSAIANAKNNHMEIERLYVYKFESNRDISKNKASRRGIGRLTNIKIELREREIKEEKPEKKKEAPKPEKKPKETMKKPEEAPKKQEKAPKPTKEEKKPPKKAEKPKKKENKK